MSGSPVYIDGKLVGAVALRLSTFSPDAICGITPIQLDAGDSMSSTSRGPTTRARRPSRLRARNPGCCRARRAAGPTGGRGRRGQWTALRYPHHGADSEAPLAFSPASRDDVAARPSRPSVNGSWASTCRAGRGRRSALTSRQASRRQAGKTRCSPGRQSVAGVLVAGDLAVTGLGTVTYNDGKRVLAFGHPFFNHRAGRHADEQRATC
jgi:hypothetical protein